MITRISDNINKISNTTTNYKDNCHHCYHHHWFVSDLPVCEKFQQTPSTHGQTGQRGRPPWGPTPPIGRQATALRKPEPTTRSPRSYTHPAPVRSSGTTGNADPVTISPCSPEAATPSHPLTNDSKRGKETELGKEGVHQPAISQHPTLPMMCVVCV